MLHGLNSKWGVQQRDSIGNKIVTLRKQPECQITYARKIVRVLTCRTNWATAANVNLGSKGTPTFMVAKILMNVKESICVNHQHFASTPTGVTIACVLKATIATIVQIKKILVFVIQEAYQL